MAGSSLSATRVCWFLPGVVVGSLLFSGCSSDRALPDDTVDAGFDSGEGDAAPRAVDATRDASEDAATVAPAEECGPEQSACEDGCVPTQVSSEHCGGCSMVCEPGDTCEAGRCIVPMQAPPCDASKLDELLATADRDNPTVELDCSVSLSAEDVITKKVRILGSEGSGVVVDCNGATLRGAVARGGRDTVLVGSRKLDDDAWDRPSDVVIRGCRIEGSIRVLGMGENGQAPDVVADSYRVGHRERAQAAAPTRILLDELTIIGEGRVPLYLAPGVTRLTFRNSEITGMSRSTVIYLDAESAFNRIVGNRLDATTIRAGIVTREVIAIDGSADNVVASNELRQLEWGGIYVYRNCGEGGGVRHQEPRRNLIAGNAFIYGDESGDLPAIWIGSRNEIVDIIATFCSLDDGYPFGSSASNEDFARDNVVADNRVQGRSLASAIRIHDEPTYLIDNVEVTTATTAEPGCAIHRPNEPPAYLPTEECD